jgi:hypothetical protein
VTRPREPEAIRGGVSRPLQLAAIRGEGLYTGVAPAPLKTGWSKTDMIGGGFFLTLGAATADDGETWETDAGYSPTGGGAWVGSQLNHSFTW